MRNHHLIVVNGYARSGKDTAVKFIRDDAYHRQMLTGSVSSIDPIADMLRGAGILFDRHDLKPKDRDLLAEVGSAVEKHSFFRTDYVIHRAREFFLSAQDRAALMFVHMREPENIKRVRTLSDQAGWSFNTVFVSRPGIERITSNVADTSVEQMSYDMTLHNDGTLDDLRARCSTLLNTIMKRDAQ